MDLNERAQTIIETNLGLHASETLLVVTDDPTREVGELFTARREPWGNGCSSCKCPKAQ